MTKERQGELFILSGTLFYGLFPVITVLSFNHLPPLISLAYSTLFSVFFFIVILTIKKSWKDVLNPLILKDVAWIALFNGVLYYVLYFVGISHTSPGNAVIIAQTEVLFSFLLFHIWHKNYISREHIGGAILMLLGACIVLYPNLSEFKMGDVLILGAAFVAPIGNFFQQRARTVVGSEVIVFMRNLISAFFLFIIAQFLFHQTATFLDVKRSLFMVLLNGILVFGVARILWIEAIHRISIVKGNALSCLNPFVTLLAAWIILGDKPTIWQLSALLPMVLGIILLGINKKEAEDIISQ